MRVIAGLVLLVLTGCDQQPPPQAVAQPRPVRVEAVVLTSPQQVLTYSGTLQARRQAELAFRVGGKVVARPVDLGARVRKGDVLARLDPSDLQLQAQASQNAVGWSSCFGPTAASCPGVAHQIRYEAALGKTRGSP